MTAPATPDRDPRQTRHNSRLLARARELTEAGWTPGEIAQRLAVEFDMDRPPSRTTIRCWVEPGFVEHRRRWRAKAKQYPGRPGRFLTDDVLLALRVEDNLSHNNISAVISRFYGVTLSEHQVRYRLDRLGAPKNHNKARSVA